MSESDPPETATTESTRPPSDGELSLPPASPPSPATPPLEFSLEDSAVKDSSSPPSPPSPSEQHPLLSTASLPVQTLTTSAPNTVSSPPASDATLETLLACLTSSSSASESAASSAPAYSSAPSTASPTSSSTNASSVSSSSSSSTSIALAASSPPSLDLSAVPAVDDANLASCADDASSASSALPPPPSDTASSSDGTSSAVQSPDDDDGPRPHATSIVDPPPLELQRSAEFGLRPAPHNEENKFNTFLKALLKMEFPEHIAKEALQVTDCQSLEVAIEFIVNLQSISMSILEEKERQGAAGLTSGDHTIDIPLLDDDDDDDDELDELGLQSSSQASNGSTATPVTAEANVGTAPTGIAASAGNAAHPKVDSLLSLVWTCKFCTFINGVGTTRCDVCGHARTDKEEEHKPGDSLMCPLCCEEIEPSSLIRSACGHDYCRRCWGAYLMSQVNERKVLKIPCPAGAMECKRLVTKPEIKDRLTEQEFAKYERFYESSKLALNPNARWCPTPGCEVVLMGSKKQPKLTCPKCTFELCFNCNEKWHGVKSCEQAGDQAMRMYKRQKNVKLCPKCKAPIERSSGCNHMTCGQCRYEFCWMCKGKYTSHHFSWWNIFGCPGLQDGPLAVLGDDRCFGVDCACGCGVCGFFKRILFRICFVILVLLAISIAIPFSPCICIYICARYYCASRYDD